MDKKDLITVLTAAPRVRRNPMAILAQVSREMLSSIFLDAADDTDKHGWRRGGAFFPSEADPQGSFRRCIWVASMRAAERRITNVAELALYVAAVENCLIGHFEVADIVDVFALNDGHSNLDEGKAWSVENLRQLATEVLTADARVLIAGMDTH